MNEKRDTSPRNLQSLFSSIKNYVEAKSHGIEFSQGKPQNVPNLYCPICAAVFGSAPPEVPLKPALCGICVDKLKEGQTALVCGNRYVFVVIPEDNVQAHARGRIMNVHPNVMEALEREYKDQVKTKPDEPTRENKNTG